jgi:hypothetical protein
MIMSSTSWSLNIKENVWTILCLYEYIYGGGLRIRNFHGILKEAHDAKMGQVLLTL